MDALIAAAFSRARTIVLTMVALILSGALAYVTIPKESMPEVDIPIFIVNVTYSGVSAEDVRERQIGHHRAALTSAVYCTSSIFSINPLILTNKCDFIV